MISKDLEAFGNADLQYRLLRGGFPAFFLDGDLPEREFQEWMDSYWAKDISTAFTRKYGEVSVKFCGLEALIVELS